MKQWNIDELRGFWQQWYFPANATLYVVGEVGRPAAEVRELIANTFGRVPPGRQPAEGSGGHHPQQSLNGSSNGNGAVPHLQQQQGPLKMRHPVCCASRVYPPLAYHASSASISCKPRGSARYFSFPLLRAVRGCKARHRQDHWPAERL